MSHKNAGKDRGTTSIKTKLLLRGFCTSFTDTMFDSLVANYLWGMNYVYFISASVLSGYGDVVGEKADYRRTKDGNGIAYVNFVDLMCMKEFIMEFNGKKLITEGGDVSVLGIEVALNQEIPVDKEYEDKLAGTYENDEDFIYFKEQMETGFSFKPSAEIQLELREEERRKMLEEGKEPEVQTAALVLDIRVKHALKKKRMEAKKEKQKEKRKIKKLQIQKRIGGAAAGGTGPGKADATGTDHLEVNVTSMRGKRKGRKKSQNRKKKRNQKKSAHVWKSK